jgi:putative peptidoglycan lipid II flippase
VRVLFERGEFGPIDTASTAAAVQMYAVGLIGYSTARIGSPIFYALGLSRVPVLVSVGAVVVNVIASVTLVRIIGFRGLALGTAIAALAHGGMALWLLRRQLGGIDGARLLSRFLRIASAAAVMGLVAMAAERWLAVVVPGDGVVRQSVRLAGGIGAALAALGATAAALRIPEFAEAMALVQARVRRPAGRSQP